MTTYPITEWFLERHVDEHVPDGKPSAIECLYKNPETGGGAMTIQSTPHITIGDTCCWLPPHHEDKRGFKPGEMFQTWRRTDWPAEAHLVIKHHPCGAVETRLIKWLSTGKAIMS